MARRSRSAGRGGFRLSFATVAALLLLVAGAAFIFFRVSGGPITTVGDDVAAAGAQTANGPYRWVETSFARVTQMWNATERIQQLERENRDLREWRLLAERLAERNARYEALLRLPRDAFGDGADLDAAIGAQLVLDSGGSFTRTLVANAGAEHGVRVGYIAVNENGLVGRVVSVGQRSSRVLLLDDYNSRIPVIGAHSRVRAVMVGQAAEPPDLITRPFALGAPRLDYAQVGLREGEPIITSGDGGLYPRGIRVGAVRQTREGLFEVALAASHDPIDFVRLIPYERPDAPERSGVVEGEGPPLNVASGIIRAGEAAARPAPPPVETAPPAAPRRQGAVNRWFGNQTPPAQQQPAQQPPAPAPAQEQEAPPAQ